MKAYRGQIRNEKGEIIFSRKGKFESKNKCLEALHKRVLFDIPTKESFLYNFSASFNSSISGISFEESPYNLGKYYTDISKLTFVVEKLN